MSARDDTSRSWRVNWGWIRRRLRSVTCRHRWMAGLTNWPEQDRTWRVQCCEKCAVWRWYPIIRRREGAFR